MNSTALFSWDSLGVAGNIRSALARFGDEAVLRSWTPAENPADTDELPDQLLFTAKDWSYRESHELAARAVHAGTTVFVQAGKGQPVFVPSEPKKPAGKPDDWSKPQRLLGRWVRPSGPKGHDGWWRFVPTTWSRATLAEMLMPFGTMQVFSWLDVRQLGLLEKTLYKLVDREFTNGKERPLTLIDWTEWTTPTEPKRRECRLLMPVGREKRKILFYASGKPLTEKELIRRGSVRVILNPNSVSERDQHADDTVVVYTERYQPEVLTFRETRRDYIRYLLSLPYVVGDYRQRLAAWYDYGDGRVDWLTDFRRNELQPCGPNVGCPTIDTRTIEKDSTGIYADGPVLRTVLAYEPIRGRAEKFKAHREHQARRKAFLLSLGLSPAAAEQLLSPAVFRATQGLHKQETISSPLGEYAGHYISTLTQDDLRSSVTGRVGHSPWGSSPFGQWLCLRDAFGRPITGYNPKAKTRNARSIRRGERLGLEGEEDRDLGLTQVRVGWGGSPDSTKIETDDFVKGSTAWSDYYDDVCSPRPGPLKLGFRAVALRLIERRARIASCEVPGWEWKRADGAIGDEWFYLETPRFEEEDVIAETQRLAWREAMDVLQAMERLTERARRAPTDEWVITELRDEFGLLRARVTQGLLDVLDRELGLLVPEDVADRDRRLVEGVFEKQTKKSPTLWLSYGGEGFMDENMTDRWTPVDQHGNKLKPGDRYSVRGGDGNAVYRDAVCFARIEIVEELIAAEDGCVVAITGAERRLQIARKAHDLRTSAFGDKVRKYLKWWALGERARRCSGVLAKDGRRGHASFSDAIRTLNVLCGVRRPRPESIACGVIEAIEEVTLLDSPVYRNPSPEDEAERPLPPRGFYNGRRCVR